MKLTTAPQYKRSPDRPFLAEERSCTTILFGNLTPKHEAFIQAVFRGCGYLCEALPLPTKANYQTGKEFCNNGLCNPNYYTAGDLVDYLRNLRRQGLSTEQICDRYIYFTLGGCGPCRFGMYESEYRLALDNAGFVGFRVVTFQSNRVIQEGSRQPGLRYTANFGWGMVNALNFGDILFEIAYRIRPFEVEPGATDRALDAVVADLCAFLRGRCLDEPFNRPQGRKENIASVIAKICHQLGGADWDRALDHARARLDDVEVDFLRVKPVVKTTGEFYSAISEGDANHNLYRFLESEGAEVLVDPIGNLLRYWLRQARGNNRRRKGLAPGYWKKEVGLAIAEWFWGWQFRRTARRLGDLALPPESQKHLAKIAAPFYDPLTRGGEGHLVVGRGLDAARRKECHLVLSVKPFGCMPATQADGVMSMLAAREPDLLFLGLETLGEGEVHALSRVQMALGEARRKAVSEFDATLRATGLTLEQARAWVAAHPEARRAFYRFRIHNGKLAGTAAQFLRHIAQVAPAQNRDRNGAASAATASGGPQ
jgi:predicted nucleotide-binding protein (sugar kinase/HSP70/actin superfamily)